MQRRKENHCCFYLFGALRVVRGAESLSLPPFRTHGLLAALLLQPHLRYRHQWVGLLFPDVREQAGRQRLSDLLYLLRQSLPMLPLETSRDGLYLSASKRWLDVEAFRKAGTQRGLDHWLKALSLYQGDLLDGYYDDWLLEEREHLRLQYVHLAHCASEGLIERQQFDEARPLIERLVQQEPFDERALRRLMQVYRALGRRGAALSAYERFVALAADELGVEPEPDTQELAQSILQTSPLIVHPVSPAALGSVPDRASADELLRLARLALQRGDRTTIKAYLETMSARFPGELGHESCLLQVDLALFFEEYDQAEQQLQSCDSSQLQVVLRLAELAMRRRRWSRAGELAAEALIEAHHDDDPPGEVSALLTLAYAQFQQGEYAQALRSAERALQLARTHAGPNEIARALVLLGRLLLLQSQQSRATEYLNKALSLAREHHLPRQEGRVWRVLGWVHFNNGELLKAQRAYERALNIWRDLGLPRREATLLQDMSAVVDHLGQTAEGIRLVEQAQAILEPLDEPVILAVCRYHLVYALLYHRDALAADAARIAQEVLSTFAAHGQSTWVASTLLVLGYAHWLAGSYQEALPVLLESYSRHEQLQELNILPEVLSLLALTHLGLGQVAEALDCTRRALLQLAQDVLPEWIVSEIYCAHALALSAQGEEARADKYFRRAYEKRLEIASQLYDEAARQAFFQRDPITRRLMREVYRRGIAEPPSAGVVKRRVPSVSGTVSVEVAWTLDAGPADQALKQAQGAIGLRRARLQRLLRESQSQGVHPTVAHLSDVLGVSTRTVRRDLAFLRHS